MTDYRKLEQNNAVLEARNKLWKALGPNMDTLGNPSRQEVDEAIDRLIVAVFTTLTGTDQIWDAVCEDARRAEQGGVQP